ncbi:MAG: DUF2917 domain-containing protein [Betaproteobacteria bacterium]
MKLLVHNSALLLERWDTIELIDAAGTTAALDDGCVWITMDGDRRDIVLGAGQSWTVERNGRTLVHAEAPTRLRLTGPVASGPIASVWSRALDRLGQWVVEFVVTPGFERKQVPYY